MKTLDKSLISPVRLSICLKSRKIVYTTSLLAVTLGIFLLPKVAYMATITPEKIIELTNVERARAGLNTLTVNPLLNQAATAKAQSIIKTQIFEHNINDRKFSSWVKEAGYKYIIVGENLAIDFITSEGVMRAWMKSPSHRENILEGEYTEIGVAIVEGEFEGQNTVIVTQILGSPLEKKPFIPENISRLNEKLLPWPKATQSQKHLSFYINIFDHLKISSRQLALF